MFTCVYGVTEGQVVIHETKNMKLERLYLFFRADSGKKEKVCVWPHQEHLLAFEGPYERVHVEERPVGSEHTTQHTDDAL